MTMLRSLRMPYMSASGRGGQPGMWRSTGRNLSAGTIAELLKTPIELEQAPIAIAHLGSSIWSYTRRTTGAILIETRPEMIIRSAWRGDARNASKPKRAMSMRGLTVAIISIAQHARPKVAGMNALPRAQLAA